MANVVERVSADKRRVAIVGGGWAGLAAAVTLAERDVPVTLYEAAATLGGRARRVISNGVTLDNGLHILLGAYTASLKLIDQVNDGATVVKRVPLHLEIPGRFRMRAARLPAPWHLLFALLGSTGLTVSQRLAACSFMFRQRLRGFRAHAGETVAHLLDRQHQPQALCESLWQPLCIAALNTSVETADAQTFLNVIQDGLIADRTASDLVLPTVDLSAMFAEPAAAYVRARGGTVRLQTPVRRIAIHGNGFEVIDDRDNEYFTHVVCATDPARTPVLLESIDALASTRSMMAAMNHSPITSVYLQYEPNTQLPFPMLGLSDVPAQWVFDRGALLGQNGLLGAVISAAAEYHGVAQDELAALTHAQLQRVVPGLSAPKWYSVISEKRATFACIPGLARPAQRSAAPGLWLAGDYTASRYPGTLEAAVRSGMTCAHGILTP